MTAPDFVTPGSRPTWRRVTTMTRALSLRSRLIAGIAIVAVVLVGVCVALTVTIRNQLIAQVDDRLRSLAPGGPGRGQTRRRGSKTLPTTLLRPHRQIRSSQRISDVYQGFINADGELSRCSHRTSPTGSTRHPTLIPPASRWTRADHIHRRRQRRATTYRVLVQPAGDLSALPACPSMTSTSTINRLIWLEVAGSAGDPRRPGDRRLVGRAPRHPTRQEHDPDRDPDRGGDLGVRVPDSRPAPSQASSPSPSTRC